MVKELVWKLIGRFEVKSSDIAMEGLPPSPTGSFAPARGGRGPWDKTILHLYVAHSFCRVQYGSETCVVLRPAGHSTQSSVLLLRYSSRGLSLQSSQDL